MKMLVTGGRLYDDNVRLVAVLDKIAEQYRPIHIIHGAARGADSMASAWARAHKIQEVACPANWRQFKNAAGPIRNRAMLKLLDPECDIVLAFAGGVGTNDMKSIATKAGVKVIEADTIN